MKVCFGNGQYEICVNALFALIEGGLLNFMGENRQPAKYNYEFILSLLKKGQYHFHEFQIHSLSALFNYYMQPMDFN